MWKRRGWMMCWGFHFTQRGYFHFPTATDTSSVPQLMLSGGLESTCRRAGRPASRWHPLAALKVALSCCHVWTGGSWMVQGCYVVIRSFWLCACDKRAWIDITSGKHKMPPREKHSSTMCTDSAFCLSLVNAVTPPLFATSLWLLLCPYRAIWVLYLEPKRYQTVQLVLCDSILTDLLLSKQSPLFLFCSFSAQLHPLSVSLLFLSLVSSYMASFSVF